MALLQRNSQCLVVSDKMSQTGSQLPSMDEHNPFSQPQQQHQSFMQMNQTGSQLPSIDEHNPFSQQQQHQIFMQMNQTGSQVPSMDEHIPFGQQQQEHQLFMLMNQTGSQLPSNYEHNPFSQQQHQIFMPMNQTGSQLASNYEHNQFSQQQQHQIFMPMNQTGSQLASNYEHNQFSQQQQQHQTFIPTVAPPVNSNPPPLNLPLGVLITGASREAYIKIGVPLYEASIKCDWEKAKSMLDKSRELVRCGITENYETALHVAASAKGTKRAREFVKNLVGNMKDTDLELQNKSGNTAMCLAAAAGNIETVKIMMDKNEKLLAIAGSEGMPPLYMAALFGHHDVVKYMYDKSNKLSDACWTPTNRYWLLVRCIETNMFDVALRMVEDIPELASNGSALGVLARKPDAFLEKESNIFMRTINWVSVCLKIRAPEKESEALQLLRIIWENIAQKPRKDIDDILRGPIDPIKQEGKPPSDEVDKTQQLQKLISNNLVKTPPQIPQATIVEPFRATTSKDPHATTTLKDGHATSSEVPKSAYSSRILFNAAKMGNTKFVVELIRLYPDLIWKVNDNNQSIFHVAVEYRHHGIYNLLYEIGSMKDLITPLKDKNDNNMLHLVGMSAKKKQLEDVTGVAFQMQRELLWFKEVEDMIPPSYREWKNKDDLTPHELFTEEHKDLLTESERWMKETASQCMVVATLIATIAFAAAFTVPGGYNQNTGFPMFHKATMIVFVVTDAMSLLSSAASILMFLSILTSRYAERDFRKSLPRKLVLGLTALFLSIATMMVAFSFSFFVLYHKGKIWIPILIMVVSTIIVLLYAYLQYPLLTSVFRSTFCSRHLFRPKKHLLY